MQPLSGGQPSGSCLVDCSVRETVRAKTRAQIKLILKRHKYPPDLEARAIDLVLKQA